MHALAPVQVVGILSAILFLPLAAWVLLARQRELANVAFSTYVIGFAAVITTHNLRVATHRVGWENIESALYLLVAVSVALLAARLPAPATRADLPYALVAAAIGVVLFVLDGTTWSAYVGASWGALLFIGLRWRTYATQDTRASAAFVSAALALFLAFQTGAGLMFRGSWDAWGVAKATMPLLLSIVWIRNAGLGGGRPAILASWVILTAMLAGMTEATLARTVEDLWGYTVMRMVSVSLLAYAVVRHQVLGADVKLRFAISRSTIAAAFIAVFFIASEAAQQFFGETLESTYLGIAAAGALVFAMAPLQRAAERLAERAVPVTTEAPAKTSAGREEAFRGALRTALRDRVLTQEEELSLAHLSDELGLTHRRAREIRLDVERDLTAERGDAAA